MNRKERQRQTDRHVILHLYTAFPLKGTKGVRRTYRHTDRQRMIETEGEKDESRLSHLNLFSLSAPKLKLLKKYKYKLLCDAYRDGSVRIGIN